MMRCDLHVHSIRSGRVNLPILRHLGNECYTSPAEIYALARRRGMDLVTISDHDTIEGALEIAHLPRVFLSEEVTVALSSGRVLHVGALGISERQHLRMAERRGDAAAFFAYCAEEQIPLVLNHPFSRSIGPRAARDFDLALTHVDLVETHNGGMPSETNAFALEACRAYGLGAVGGSDAHARRSIGRTWTEVRGARSKEDFLDGLRRRCTASAGESGSYARLTRDALSIVSRGYGDALLRTPRGAGNAARLAALLLTLPALPLLPLLTGIVYVRERSFGRATYRRWQANAGRPRVRRPSSHLPSMGGELPEVSIG